MEPPKILARVIGPLFIIAAAGILLNLEAYQGLIKEFSNSLALCYLAGFMALLLGLIVLQFQNTWEPRWPVLITILGWITVVKGAALVVLPGPSLRIWYSYTGSPVPLIVSSATMLAVGTFLTIRGYWR